MAKRANFSVRHVSRLFDEHVRMSAGQSSNTSGWKRSK
jgi:transcriptional regulator GlxA family with amidase domain